MTVLDRATDAGVVAVAEQLGFSLVRGRTISPCPACGASERGSRGTDKRGPVGLTRDGLGWRCHRCQAHGSAVTFAAWHVAGTDRPHNWSTVLDELRRGDFTPQPRAVSAVTELPRRPRQRELLDLWGCSVPITDDRAAAEYLRGRGIDPALVDDRELARSIPPNATMPAWAFLRGPWTSTGYRLLLPLWGADGRLATLHTRNLVGADPKGAMPAGYEVSGSVFADAAGVRMLENGELFGHLWLVEGATDFLKTATSWTDEADTAVLGIVSGSWTADIAARVPDGAHVVVAVHHDEAGERYVAKIVTSLASRVHLERWAPGVAA